MPSQTKYHTSDCYDIWPYSNCKDDVLACYDRELYYYTHANPEDYEDFFDDDASVSDFVDELKRRRSQFLGPEWDEIFRGIDSEPRVLVHEDFHAGNMLVRNGKLVALLDWEFSGVYPLSELLGMAQIVQISVPFEDRTDETDQEENKWDERYRCVVREIVEQRGWAKEDIETLRNAGHDVLRTARTIMFPSPG